MRKSFSILALAVALSMVPAAQGSAAVVAPVSPMPAVDRTDIVPVYHRQWHRPHCHRSVSRHYHPSIGRSAWHRHVGNYCRAKVFRRFQHRPYYPGCFRVGPFWFCP
jgi:hypothetical protein